MISQQLVMYSLLEYLEHQMKPLTNLPLLEQENAKAPLQEMLAVLLLNTVLNLDKTIMAIDS